MKNKNIPQGHFCFDKSKQVDQSGFVSILLGILIVLIVGGGIYFYTKQKNTTDHQTIPVDTNLVKKIEMQSERDGKMVKVIVTKDGAVLKQFSYEEFYKIDDSTGKDIYIDNPPNATLSPDNKLIAYADNTRGLTVLNLETGSSTIVRPYPGNSIVWSPDSRYFIYVQPGYELHSFGIADVVTKKYRDDVMGPNSVDITWVLEEGGLSIKYRLEDSCYGGCNDDFVPGTYQSKVDPISSIKFVKIK